MFLGSAAIPAARRVQEEGFLLACCHLLPGSLVVGISQQPDSGQPMSRRNVGVAPGHLQVFVAENLGNGQQVHSLHTKV